MISVLPFGASNCLSGSPFPLCWLKLLIELLFPIQYSGLAQVFQFFIINFICEIKNTSIFEHLIIKCSKTFMRKALALTLQSVFLWTLEMS